MSAIHDEAFPEFEKLGEAEVRHRLATNGIHIMKQAPAREWLALKEAESKARADARDEESVSISRKALSISASANDISRSAKKWAIIAMIVSTISAAAIAAIQIVFGSKP
ncbi:MAG: hypothetical protein IV108_07810 [Burkholderiales bacterium]|nr:hypothetical protein [Burkholderiales bacterium]